MILNKLQIALNTYKGKYLGQGRATFLLLSPLRLNLDIASYLAPLYRFKCQSGKTTSFKVSVCITNLPINPWLLYFKTQSQYRLNISASTLSHKVPQYFQFCLLYCDAYCDKWASYFIFFVNTISTVTVLLEKEWSLLERRINSPS